MRLYYDAVTGAATFTLKADPASALAPPGPFVVVPDDFAEPLAGLSVVDGQIQRHDMGPVRAEGIAQVNAASDAVRKLFVTEIAGQQMLYLRKETEARAFLAADPEPETLEAFPLIASEIGITGETAYQVATIFSFLAAQWLGLATTLESLRLGAIARIEAAPDAASVAAIVQEVEASLSAIDPGAPP